MAAGYLGQLYRSVVIAMVAMGMMQPSVHEVILIAVRYGLCPHDGHGCVNSLLLACTVRGLWH